VTMEAEFHPLSSMACGNLLWVKLAAYPLTSYCRNRATADKSKSLENRGAKG
jgi:hypothetical protein